MEKQKSPKIRFKGFDQNWIEKNFGDFSSVQMCRRIFKSETKTKDEVPFFKIGTFGSIPDAFISRELYQEYIDKYPYPEIGDVLLSASGTIGRTVIYKGESAYYQDSNIIWLKLDKSKISNNFLLPFYALKRWNNIEGSTIKRLYNSDLLSTRISYPILSEQESIGVFFQNLEQSIALHEKKLSQTQNLKKAMLEKMFPKAGSKQPEIRLKGFSGDWELKSLSDVSEKFEYGLNAQATTFDGINKYIRITDIDDESRKFILDDITSPNVCFENCEKYKLSTGDILFARTGASVGKTYIYLEEDGLVYFAGFLIRAKVKDTFDANFIFINTLTERFNKFVLLASQRSGQPGINAKEYGEYEFYCPNKDEQESIGRFFRHFDATLVLQQQQLKTLKNLKQAFLEKMFV
ncbi:restriction endonuclease subunit S [Acinetobacter sp. PFS20]|uniref:restriction endonuclease subunit S n=1 Tax=Acinetobacter sp. PFS20 TaxID=3458434 RepID=UPI003FD11AE1